MFFGEFFMGRNYEEKMKLLGARERFTKSRWMHLWMELDRSADLLDDRIDLKAMSERPEYYATYLVGTTADATRHFGDNLRNLSPPDDSRGYISSDNLERIHGISNWYRNAMNYLKRWHGHEDEWCKYASQDVELWIVGNLCSDCPHLQTPLIYTGDFPSVIYQVCDHILDYNRSKHHPDPISRERMRKNMSLIEDWATLRGNRILEDLPYGWSRPISIPKN